MGCAASCKSGKNKAVFSRAQGPGWTALNEVCYESSCRCVPPAPLHRHIRMEWFLIFAGGPLGIFGPILLIAAGLWLARGDRSPWYVKAALLALLALLLLVLFRIL